MVPEARQSKNRQSTRFFYGQIVSWSFRPTITPVKDTYAFRYTLYFENGKQKDFQKGGFKTKAQAQKAKEALIIDLGQKRHVPFSFTVKEFYDFWLYIQKAEVDKVSYQAFTNYRSAIYNYMIPFWGESRKMQTIDRASIYDMLESIPYKSVLLSGPLLLLQNPGTLFPSMLRDELKPDDNTEIFEVADVWRSLI